MSQLEDNIAKVFAAIPQRPAPAPPTPAGGRIISALTTFRTGIRTRLDSWVNDVTGFGTSRDKTTHGFVMPSRLLVDSEISALYHSDDMAARMVDVVPQEMFREGFVVETGDADADTILAAKHEDLNTVGALTDGFRWGRAYGGAGVILGADDGRDSSLPLIPEQADDLDYLYVVDRRLLWPLTWYEEAGPKFGHPKTYLVTAYGGTAYASSVIHESRLVLFGGAPTGIREKNMMFGWDMSVLQRAYDILRQFNTGWKAVETMMTDGNQAIFKMTGLSDILRSPGGGEEMLRTRLQAIDLYRSVMRAIVVDADGKESFERHSVSFSEIPATLDKFMLRLAATVEIPVTILMGQSPAGMNATGESDFRWFYDRMRAGQRKDGTPRVRRISDVWLRTRAGRAAIKAQPKQIGVKWPALWTETPLAQAQRELAIAQRDAVYITNQVIDPDEAAIQRFRPEGFSNELILSPEALAVRETTLKATYKAMVAPPPETQAEAPAGGTAAPEIAPAAGEDKPVEIPLAPTDIAAVVTVNEARRSLELGAFKGPEGELTLVQFKAANASTIADVAAAEAGTDPDAPKPAAPAFGGGGGFGGGGFGGRPVAVPGQQTGGPAEADAKPAPKQDDGVPTNKEIDDAKAEAERFDAAPRTFTLFRKEDESGVSGTGEVAEGCQFADGRVAMRWRTATSSTTLFDNIDHVLKVHGHAGKTEIRWHEAAHLDAKGKPFVIEEHKPDGTVVAHTFSSKAEAKAAGMALRVTNDKIYMHESNSPFRDKNAKEATAAETHASLAQAHANAASAHAAVGNQKEADRETKLSTAHAAAASGGKSVGGVISKGDGAGGGGDEYSRDEAGRFAPK